jgi:hypothetical protein
MLGHDQTISHQTDRLKNRGGCTFGEQERQARPEVRSIVVSRDTGED